MSEAVVHQQLVLDADDSCLGYVDSNLVEAWIKEHGAVYGRKSSLGGSLKSDSDLVPDVYEGGLKLWECSVDLVQYLMNLKKDFQDSNVLELGCGAGLPGIYALMNGATVHFQDYNWEVLDFIAIPNVLLNTAFRDRLGFDESDVIEEAISDGESGDNEENSSDEEEYQTENVTENEAEVPCKRLKQDLKHSNGDSKPCKQKFKNKSKKTTCGNFVIPPPPLNKTDNTKSEFSSDSQHFSSTHVESETKLPPEDKVTTETSTTLEKKPCKQSSDTSTLVTKDSKNSPEKSSALVQKNSTEEISSLEEKDDINREKCALEEVARMKQKCRFIAGDWTNVSTLLSKDNIKYDIILTSETIYSVSSYGRLHSTLQALLKPAGKIILAAKSYYFGVGGGTHSWIDFVNKQGVFNVQSCVVFDKGLKREIMQLEFKEK